MSTIDQQTKERAELDVIHDQLFVETQLHSYNTLVLKYAFLISTPPSSSPANQRRQRASLYQENKISSKSNDTTLNTFLTHQKPIIFHIEQAESLS
jgi:hypothetical protein